MLSKCSIIMGQMINVLQGLLENPPPSDSPHNIIICGDDQNAVTDAKQLTDCQPGFKVGSRCCALEHDSTGKCCKIARSTLACKIVAMQQQRSLTQMPCLMSRFLAVKELFWQCFYCFDLSSPSDFFTADSLQNVCTQPAPVVV